MKRHEIIRDEAGIRVRAEGTTRPALFTAALEGVFAATAPTYPPGEADHLGRSFSVTADNVQTLLANLLNQALKESDERGEAYDDITFVLVTDTKAEGVFLGRAVETFGTKISSVRHEGITIQKNAENNWETTITLEPASVDAEPSGDR